MDADLLHISNEGGGLEDPWSALDEVMWRWTLSSEAAPKRAEEIKFANSDAAAR